MSTNISLHRSQERTCLSPCSKYLALVGVDETVRVWQNHNGKLLHELQPPKQLTTPISAILFAPQDFSSDDKNVTDENSILALGTVDGRIILYDWSLKKIIKQTQIKAEGVSGITSLIWEDNRTLCVLTSENRIYLWNVTTNKFDQQIKVKGNRSFCRLDAGQYAVASQSIEIVARKAENIPKPCRFTGHSTPVSVLYSIKSEKGHFLVSASSNDSFVYMWNTCSNQTPDTTKGKNPSNILVTMPYLTLKVGQGVTSVTSSNRIIVAVSVSGSLHVFYVNYHRGSPQGPVLPSTSLTLYSSESRRTITPIVKVIELTDTKILFAYGIEAALQFETISMSSLVGNVQFVRNTKNSTCGVSKSIPFLSTNTRSKKTTYANPLNMPEVKASSLHGKRTLDEEKPESRLPISTLLASLSTEEANNDSSYVPTFSNNCQTHLLLQGLHSDNHKMMSKVLSSSNPMVIRSTLSKLPVTAVLSLFQYFSKHCLPVWHTKTSYSLWLKELLLQHNSYFSSQPQCKQLFKPFIKYAEVKENSMNNLMMLKVRLNLLQLQIDRTNVLSRKSNKEYEPLVCLVDDSDTEEEIIKNSSVNGMDECSKMVNGTNDNSDDDSEESDDNCIKFDDSEDDDNKNMMEVDGNGSQSTDSDESAMEYESDSD